MKNDDCSLQLYIIRHAQSLSNAVNDGYDFKADIEWDKLDPPLSDLGIRQAFEAGRRFENKHIDTLIVSPFLRTRQTAHEILKFLPGVEPEINLDACEKDTAADADGNLIIKPESDNECLERAGRFLKYLNERFCNSESVVLVTHAVYTGFLIHSVLGTEDLKNKQICIYNTGITKIKFYKNGITKIAFINDTGHIPAVEEDRIFWI